MGVESCTVEFRAGHFLFTSSDTFDAGCIDHLSHKNWKADWETKSDFSFKL